MFSTERYSNKLLVLEKETMIKAMIRTSGNVKKAYKLLCPNGYFYSYNALLKRLQNHGIKKEDYK